MEKKNKSTKKDQITTLETKQLFEGDVHCYKCGQVQTYEGLMNNGECCNCGVSLIGELF